MGKCRADHLSDQKLNKPHAKFAKGQEVQCLVLECDPERNKLMLSLKARCVLSALHCATYY